MFQGREPRELNYHDTEETVKIEEVPVGIDVSYRTLCVHIDGESTVREYANDDEGHLALVTELTKRGRHVRIVLEATGTYHLDTALALSAHSQCRVSVVNPRQTKHFHDAQNIRAKTDPVDAKSLCAYARRMDFVEWAQPTRTSLALRALVRHHAQLTKERTRTSNRAHALQVSASTPPLLLDMLSHQIEFIDEQLKALEALLEHFEQEHPSITPYVLRLMTIPGVGRTTALSLLSEYLLLDQTMTSRQITAWAGLDPRPHESGASQRRRSISKRGSARTRAALYFPAITVTRLEGPLQDFYLRIVERTGQKMVGITAVMRKLITISWAMHRNATDWDAQMAAPRTQQNQQAA